MILFSHIVVRICIEEDRELSVAWRGVTQHEQRDEHWEQRIRIRTCPGQDRPSLTQSKRAEDQSDVLTEGVAPGELDEGGEDPAQVVPGVEEEEAGHRGEVDVGPGVPRALVLTLHQDRHAGEDGQRGEEYQEDAQEIFPG